jgi:hypothetical protein
MLPRPTLSGKSLRSVLAEKRRLLILTIPRTRRATSGQCRGQQRLRVRLKENLRLASEGGKDRGARFVLLCGQMSKEL